MLCLFLKHEDNTVMSMQDHFRNIKSDASIPDHVPQTFLITYSKHAPFPLPQELSENNLIHSRRMIFRVQGKKGDAGIDRTF